MSERNKLIDRVRKLFAMSQDASSKPEAEIAARRCDALRAEHGITLADIQRATADAMDVTASASGNGGFRKSAPRWYGVLAYGVGVYCDCRSRRGRADIVFHGVGDDAAVAAMTLDYLVGVMERGAKLAHADAVREAKASAERDGAIYGLPGRGERWQSDVTYRHAIGAREFKGSFRNAFASEMQARLKELAAERAAEHGTDSRALVVTKGAILAAKYGPEDSRKVSMRGGQGSDAGRAAARAAGLNRQVNGASARAALT